MDETNNTNQYYQQQSQAPVAKINRPGEKGFILGLISVILLSFFHNPFLLLIIWIISIFGLVYSIKGIRFAPRGFAIAGLVLSAFPLAYHFISWLISDMIKLFGA